LKRLLNTLYISDPNYYLSLDGENVVVKEDETIVGRVPLHTIDSIVSFGYRGVSPKLLGHCMDMNITISFLNESGRLLAAVSQEPKGNVLLRRTQFHVADKEESKLEIAKNIILAKIYNSKWILERMTRDYAARIDPLPFKQKSEILSKALLAVKSVASAEALRGIEGEAAANYFAVFDDMILQQKEHFWFHGRTRRPPTDNVNALLSFTYSLLASMSRSALACVGLDPYVGFYHTDRPGRFSLALDLMEEFRGVLADRFVLSLINCRIVNEKGFFVKEDGAVVMSDDMRKQVLEAWQQKKREVITHPFLEEKIEWGMAPYVQAMLLARFLRGDLDTYPSFLWK